MLLYPSMVRLLAHHQMLHYCSLAISCKARLLNEKQESGFARLAEISARSSGFSLRSLSVHFDPRSLLGLTTLVAAVVIVAPMHGTVAGLQLGPRVLTVTS